VQFSFYRTELSVSKGRLYKTQYHYGVGESVKNIFLSYVFTTKNNKTPGIICRTRKQYMLIKSIPLRYNTMHPEILPLVDAYLVVSYRKNSAYTLLHFGNTSLPLPKISLSRGRFSI